MPRTTADIREYMSGNLCRCAAYPNIVAAIKQAKPLMEEPDDAAVPLCARSTVRERVARRPARPGAGRTGADAYLAGGTTLIDLMKLDVHAAGAAGRHQRAGAAARRDRGTSEGLRLGALARMAEVADHAAVRRDYPGDRADA